VAGSGSSVSDSRQIPLTPSNRHQKASLMLFNPDLSCERFRRGQCWRGP
jgi:hypothetical protein